MANVLASTAGLERTWEEDLKLSAGCTAHDCWLRVRSCCVLCAVRSSSLKEDSLWKAYANSKSHELHEQLVEMYLPFVYKEVTRLSIRVRQKIEKDELVSAGVIGLHNAVSKFQPEIFRNFRLHRFEISTLAVLSSRFGI